MNPQEAKKFIMALEDRGGKIWGSMDNFSKPPTDRHVWEPRCRDGGREPGWYRFPTKEDYDIYEKADHELWIAKAEAWNLAAHGNDVPDAAIKRIEELKAECDRLMDKAVYDPEAND